MLLGFGLFLSSISGIISGIYAKKHIMAKETPEEDIVLKIVVVGMRQLDFVVVCYVGAMYASI